MNHRSIIGLGPMLMNNLFEKIESCHIITCLLFIVLHTLFIYAVNSWCIRVYCCSPFSSLFVLMVPSAAHIGWCSYHCGYGRDWSYQELWLLAMCGGDILNSGKNGCMESSLNMYHRGIIVQWTWPDQGHSRCMPKASHVVNSQK